METFTIGSLVLPSTAEGGLGWWFSGLKDWNSLTSTKTRRDSRPQAHGDFEEEQDFRESAAITVTVHFGGSSHTEVLAAMDELKSIGRGLQQASLTDSSGHTRRREVSIQGIPIPDEHGASAFSATVDMLAADPFMYGDAVVATTGLPVSGSGYGWPAVWPDDWGTGGDPGRLATLNGGTQETFSLFWATGGMSEGFEVLSIEDGRRFRFERVVPLGSTVWVDPSTGLAWIDDPGNDVSRFLTISDWWSVPPGETRTIQFTSIGTVTGTPILSASTSPAYL